MAKRGVYAHPKNVYFVSSTFVGDEAVSNQYYRTVAEAVSDAPAGTIVMSYDERVSFNGKTGVTVLFMNELSNALDPANFVSQIVFSDGIAFMGLDYPKVWEGIVIQADTDPPTLVSTERNDFGIALHATPFLFINDGIYDIRFASAITDDVNKIRVLSRPLDTSFPNQSLGNLIGATSGITTSKIRFGTQGHDGAYANDLIDSGIGTLLTIIKYP